MLVGEDHWEPLQKWGDSDVISVALSELGTGVNAGAQGEEPVLGAQQSPHLCCIMGWSQRPRTVDIPARPPDCQLSDTPNELGQISSLL